jgi:5'(3')-deoxyribonucleotidase
MKKQIIAVDIDDVLADSTEALRLEVNQRLGIGLQAEHYNIAAPYWGYYEQVWKQHGANITLDELDSQMEASQMHVAPARGAKSVLRHLHQQFAIIAVTSRAATWRPATEQWAEHHFGGIIDKIVFTDNSRGARQTSKGIICASEGAQWLIDDNYEHCASAEVCGVQPILFGEYGWNQQPSDFIRCKDWQSVKEYFDA